MAETPPAHPQTAEDLRLVVEHALAKTRGAGDSEAIASDQSLRGTLVEQPAADTTLPPMRTEELPLVAVHPTRSTDASVNAAANESEWLVRSLLGQGGMGQVYSGEQRSIGRGVAVKVATGEREARAALLREARITGRLEHPNIVPVHVLGVDEGGVPVMVMKRIEGVSWRALLRDREHPQWRRWETQHRDALEAHVSVLLSVCDALEYAHKKRIVHRDIKPDNVMIGPFGEVYLLDWGIALDLDAPAPSSDGSIFGTPAYMPPELVDAESGASGPWTDVYLLGSSLYEALEGRPPHHAPTLVEALLSAYMSSPPTFSRDPPASLAALCAAAMRRAPDERTESVAAFAAALREWLVHRDSLASSSLGDASLAALDARGPDRPDELALALDARLAFERALRLWPENARAEAGLVRALRSMFLAEIARHNATGARALLDELASREAALAEDREALADLEAKESAARAEAERAKEAQRQLDLSGWRGPRVWLFAVVTLVSALAATSIARAPTPSFVELVRADVAVIAVILGAIAIFRRRITANRIGRQLAAVLVLCALASATIDVFGLWLRWPLIWASTHRLIAIGAVLSFAGLMGLRALFVSAAIAGAGAVTVLLFPDRQVTITPAVLLSINVVTGWLVASGRVRSTDAIE